MAQKARFHRFKEITGHGIKEWVLPATTKHEIENVFRENQAIKIEFIESNIWKVVRMLPDPSISLEVFFCTDDGYEYHQGQLGFNYLKNQFRKGYDELIESITPKDDY